MHGYRARWDRATHAKADAGKRCREQQVVDVQGQVADRCRPRRSGIESCQERQLLRQQVQMAAGDGSCSTDAVYQQGAAHLLL